MTQEERRDKYIVQTGRCGFCGDPKALREMEAAHRIPRTKQNLKQYGPEIIDHPWNLVLVCRGSSRCNDGCLMSRAAHPLASALLIDRIKKDLEEK